VQIRVTFHFEGIGWWAESDALPGWTAAGSDYEDVRRMAEEGIREFAGDDAEIIADLVVPETPATSLAADVFFVGWLSSEGALELPVASVSGGAGLTFRPGPELAKHVWPEAAYAR
jgi:predicted RNase H-like HicB family nuclease